MNWIYLMKDDEFTCMFSRVDSDKLLQGSYPERIEFSKVEGPESGRDRAFLIAAAVIHVGERSQRRLVERKVKKGTRNIKSLVGHSARYLGLARNPEGMTEKGGKGKQKMMKECQQQLSEVIAVEREKVGCDADVASRWSYIVTDDVLDVAEVVGCSGYFEPLKEERFFAPDLVKIETAIKAYEGSHKVLNALKKTKTDDHLAMVSLVADEEEGLLVTFVDPKGHYLTVEASRLVEMLGAEGQARRLHVFPPRGHRQPVAFAFNSNTQGEIIGKFLPEEMKLDLVCCQGQGQYSNVHDRAWFYLDPEYLLCLWIVLNRLEQDRFRYTQLKSTAEARVNFDPFVVGASL